MFQANFLLHWKEFFPRQVLVICNTHVTGFSSVKILHWYDGESAEWLQVSLAVQNPKNDTLFAT